METNYILAILCFIPLILYIVKLRNFKLTVKKMVIIAMFSGIAFILDKIVIIQYPQGGGITLLSSMPILFVGLILGPIEGMTTGLITGILSLMGGYIIHPIQLFLDFIIPPMFLGLCGMFGNDSKVKIFIGGLIVVILKCFIHTVSGVIFFASYAEQFNVGPWLYSMVYNLSSQGVEGFLSLIAVTLIPMQKIKIIAQEKRVA